MISEAEKAARIELRELEVQAEAMRRYPHSGNRSALSQITFRIKRTIQGIHAVRVLDELDGLEDPDAPADEVSV